MVIFLKFIKFCALLKVDLNTLKPTLNWHFHGTKKERFIVMVDGVSNTAAFNSYSYFRIGIGSARKLFNIIL